MAYGLWLMAYVFNSVFLKLRILSFFNYSWGLTSFNWILDSWPFLEVSLLFGSFLVACVNLATMNPTKQFSDLPKERNIISKFLRFRQHPYFSSFKMAEDQLGNHLEVTPDRYINLYLLSIYIYIYICYTTGYCVLYIYTDIQE